jgi:lysophospholipid acyltransferase (LPLAT)-like uncharacterized protein
MKRYIEAPSWDRLQIPLPFSSAVLLIGEALFVERGGPADEPKVKQAMLQSTLDRLRSEGEAWRTGQPSP